MSLEKMRPNLFRMASDLKQNEDGMTEILQANDDLMRVMDQYKRTIGEGDGKGRTETTTVNGATAASETASSETTSGATATTGATAVGSNDSSNDVLIDLADFNFGETPGATQGATNTSTLSSVPAPDNLGLFLGGVPSAGSTSQDFVSKLLCLSCKWNVL